FLWRLSSPTLFHIFHIRFYVEAVTCYYGIYPWHSSGEHAKRLALACKHLMMLSSTVGERFAPIFTGLVGLSSSCTVENFIIVSNGKGFYATFSSSEIEDFFNESVVPLHSLSICIDGHYLIVASVVLHLEVNG
ncbi:hypothetical protein A2U01_0040156, partial [Trifolium medium]|nr:hypothetical protein [Trifolium medium]